MSEGTLLIINTIVGHIYIKCVIHTGHTIHLSKSLFKQKKSPQLLKFLIFLKFCSPINRWPQRTWWVAPYRRCPAHPPPAVVRHQQIRAQALVIVRIQNHQILTINYGRLLIGTDTVKRGASPAISITSTSTAKFRESGSSYSIKAQELSSKDNRDTATTTIERQKSNTSSIYGSSILPPKGPSISSNLGSALSSYSIKEQVKSSTNNNTSSVSKSIEQVLSPLAQHRNIAQSSNQASDSSYILKSQTNSNTSLGTYQFPSSSINPKTNSSASYSENLTTPSSSSSSSSSMRKSSSPSRSISNTNTLPSNIARNLLYQSSDSSYLFKPQQTTNPTSPGNNNSHAQSTISGSSSMSLYGTLPKTSSGPFGTGANSMQHYNVNVQAASNEFELLSRPVTTSNGGYNTLGSYRVQYSSTNPFLPSFNPQQMSDQSSSSNNDKINED